MRSVARYGGVVWLVVGLALAACMGPPRAGPGGVAEPLGGTAWQLAELNGEPAAVGTEDAVPTLLFGTDEARASGNGGCNQFNGPYSRNGKLLSFGPLASTRRACVDEAANRQETAYLRALETTTRYAVYDDLLVLYAADDVVARLRRRGG